MMNFDRREFLKILGGTAAWTAWSRLTSTATWAREPVPTGEPASQPIEPDKSLVVRVRSNRLFKYESLNRRMLREMIEYGMKELAGADSFEGALKQMFSKKDIIGFKFNSSQAPLLGTNVPLAEEFLRLFHRAGYDPGKMLFIEVQPVDENLPACGKVRFGWGPETDFGSGRDSFACVLDQVTALVNVGMLKANAVAGMSGCLKNLAYGLIKHPYRYHARGCTPYIADIYRLPIIRSKVRLNVLSALKILIRTEQFHLRDAVVEDASLLFGHDVVAVDATGFEILDALRKKKGLPSLVEEIDFPRQLVAAAQKGLGVYHPDQIQQKGINQE